MEAALKYAFLIALLPMITSVFALLFKNKYRTEISNATITIIAVSFFHACLVLIGSLKGLTYDYSYTWLTLGSVDVSMGFMVDELTALMLFIVTGVSLLVQIYSQGYMHEDPRYSTYYAFLTFFSASMLGLVMSNNILEMFIFWELVGVSSYLLIGFWYTKDSAANASKKAFITTKIGDMGFFVGLMALFIAIGSFQFTDIFAQVSNLAPGLISLIALLLFFGAMGKSAQFPLHVWLPNAMEGPTPVSALIHAATMVVAGIFMVARMYPLFTLSPGVMEFIAYVGAITAIFAATIAIVQKDIKAVLAYSTISQLGYMIAALGVGAYTAGLYHMTTHAFFKALLFLGAGSVIHAVGTQNMEEMGGLRSKMPKTFWTYMIAFLCLSGIPPFSGFFSKDEILAGAYDHNTIIFTILVAAAFLTAFYMTRQVALVFFGKARDKKKFDHAHESPMTMAAPLMVLAVMSIVVGVFGIPGHSLFGSFIHFGHAAHVIHWDVMLISVLFGGAGVFLGFLVYGKGIINPAKWAKTLSPLYTLLEKKYYIDELYELIAIRFNKFLADCMAWFDKNVIDQVVNLVARVTYLLAHFMRLFDTHVVDGIVNLTGVVVKQLSRLFRFSQTGYVQNYLLVVVVGLIVLVIAGFIGVVVL